MRKIQEPEEPWDLTKIIISVVTIIGIIAGGFYLKQTVLDTNSGSVKGVKVEFQDKKESSFSQDSEKPSNISYPNLQNEFYKRLGQVKEEVGSLSLTEVASSSAQIQKILKDIEALKEYPGNQARQMCESICRSF